ncbi:MAG: MFS transporter [Methanomassiliicoccaceae archaeon]|nr:MFS transporter [Methanomassiliicoccaceae archaeon]
MEPPEDDTIPDSDATGASDTAAEQRGQDSYAMTVLSVTTVGALLATVQGSALLIVLPELMRDLRMEFMTLLWVLLVYLMVTTILVPVLGRASDMFGRKRMYVLGFGVFALGSLLCGLSNPALGGWDMVGFRVVQAAGGAMLLANSTAMITDAFARRRLGFGLGVNQVAAAAGIVVGPVVGGVLAPLGWEWIFLVNVPLGLFGMAWAAYRLREPEWVAGRQRFDWAGTVAFFIGLFGVLTALTYVSFGDPGLMFTAYATAAVGAAGMAAFLIIESHAAYPMMDLRLFRNRTYAVGNLVNLLNGLCMGAATFLLIFYFQGPCGMDALTAGLLLIPSGLPMMIVGPLSGKWSDAYGPRSLTLAGLALTTAALAGLAFIDSGTPLWEVAALMVLIGVGGGLFASPNASSVMTSVPPGHRGTASGTRMMLRNTGTMFSLAVAFPLVLAGLSPEDMQSIFFGGGTVSDAALAMFEHGLSEAFLVFTAISVASVAVALMSYSRRSVRPP